MNKKKLPKIIISTIVRTAQKGDTHGRIYIVDLENENFEQVLNWDDESINWDGRGGDRGLRGIAFHNDYICIAVSAELLLYDKHFNFVERYTNKYLKDCHETYSYGNTLYLTSSGYDSILLLDLLTKSFTKGYCIRYKGETYFQKQIERVRKKFLKKYISPKYPSKKYNFFSFDPEQNNGPSQIDTIHLNSVYVNNGTIYFAGQKNTASLLQIHNDELAHYGELSNGSHNATPYENKIIYNDTHNDLVKITNKFGKIIKSFDIIKYDEKTLTNTDVPKNYARQGWARGLAIFENEFIIVGSSPTTISLYSMQYNYLLKSIQLSNDIRDTIHGLEIWPF